MQKSRLLSWWYGSSEHFGVRDAPPQTDAAEPGQITRVEAPLWKKCSNCNEDDTRCQDPVSFDKLNETVYKLPLTGTCYNKDTLERWFARKDTHPEVPSLRLEPHSDFEPPFVVGEDEGVALVATTEEEDITLAYVVKIPEYVEEGYQELVEESMARSAAVNLLGYYDEVINDDNFAEFMRSLHDYNIQTVNVLVFGKEEIDTAVEFSYYYGVSTSNMEPIRESVMDLIAIQREFAE